MIKHNILTGSKWYYPKMSNLSFVILKYPRNIKCNPFKLDFTCISFLKDKNTNKIQYSPY